MTPFFVNVYSELINKEQIFALFRKLDVGVSYFVNNGNISKES